MNRLTSLFFLLASVVGAAFVQPFAVTPLTPAYASATPLMPMSVERFSSSAATANGKIYVFGGLSYSGMVHLTEEYDPVRNSWRTRRPMPTARLRLAAATGPDGLVYAVGGTTGPFAADAVGIVEVYDPIADAWSTRRSLPTPRYGLALVAHPNGRLYAIGGYDVHGELSTVDEYDPATNSWRSRTSASVVRGFVSATVSNGFIYATGVGFSAEPSLEVYDPAADLWTTKAPMPTGRRGVGVAASNGRVYAFGGLVGTGQNSPALAVVEEYDPLSNVWSRRADMPTARAEMSVVELNGAIYVAGGLSGIGSFSDFPILPTLEGFDAVAGAWTPEGTPPQFDAFALSGPSVTSSTSVTLTLSASDKGSGVQSMSFSNDGSSWSSWQPYAPTAVWTVSETRGKKTIFGRVRDVAGNVSLVRTVTVTIGTVGGAGLGISPEVARNRLSWTGDGDESGYLVVRDPSATAELAAALETFTDVAPAWPPTVNCYVLFPLGMGGLFDILGVSDALCARQGFASPVGAPQDFTLRLNQSSTASLSWVNPPGTVGSVMIAIPVDGSPPRYRALATSATSLTDETGGVLTCYMLVAATPTGPVNTDLACGLPGVSTLGTAAAPQRGAAGADQTRAMADQRLERMRSQVGQIGAKPQEALQEAKQRLAQPPQPDQCTPRPRLNTTSVPAGGGRLQVTVSAGTTPGATANRLLELRAKIPANARIDVVNGPSDLTGEQLLPVGDGTQPIVFVVRRVAPGGVTIPLEATDACGVWPTFVGGGANAL